ncbi:hypothetical protein GCM10027200_73390 [Lentzea nigeriaca]
MAGEWTGTGFMGERGIDAGMASPAPSDVPKANRGTSTSEKTTCSRHCHICLFVRTAGPVEEGVGEEPVDQVREQRLQIHYDDVAPMHPPRSPSPTGSRNS